MSITRAIKRAYAKKVKRNYPFMFWKVDVHDTIFPSTYSEEDDLTPYPFAIEALKMLTEMEYMKIILWTSTPRKRVEEIVEHLETLGVHVDFINENPMCTAKGIYDFNGKFYFDIGVDDKFGFNPEEDWAEIIEEIVELYHES